ncbi:MAG: hypothetical protein IKW60_05650 [Clostridia bacterium]|nr:hypothetical protein [Clostridia bacterium]
MEINGNLFAYASGDPFVLYSHAMFYNIPDCNYFEDKAGQTEQLGILLGVVAEGDAIVVGSITDFMAPSVYEMCCVLEMLEEKGVMVISRLEPDFDLGNYRSAIALANNISRRERNLSAE